MYAIVEIAGQQFKVEKDQKIFVHRLEAEEGGQVEFAKVLLVDNEGEVVVGAPAVEGAKVTAEVVSHGRHKKVKIVKFKRRKHHMKQMGHRQWYTEIKITGIKA